MISFVVAMDQARLIGQNNQLPWHLPNDLKYFRELTTGHTVVMGRKTFESIGKPLPHRTNVVLTTNRDYQAEGCQVIHSLEEIGHVGQEELFVIGGAEIFKSLLDQADRLYVTLIEETFVGDTYFPEIDPAVWEITSRKPGTVDEKNRYAHEFLVYDRI